MTFVNCRARKHVNTYVFCCYFAELYSGFNFCWAKNLGPSIKQQSSGGRVRKDGRKAGFLGGQKKWSLTGGEHQLEKQLVISGYKRSPPPILGQRYSFNSLARSFPILSTFLNFRVVPTNIHGMWPRRPWCWVQGWFDVTVITWKHMQVIQQSLLHCTFTSHTKWETFRFALPAWNLFTQENESRAWS